MVAQSESKSSKEDKKAMATTGKKAEDAQDEFHDSSEEDPKKPMTKAGKSFDESNCGRRNSDCKRRWFRRSSTKSHKRRSAR